MHTILGAGGAIGAPLAKSLKENHGKRVRIVGRKPEKVNPDDELFVADLLDAGAVHRAVAGSAVAYLCVGLPYKAKLWKREWPRLMRHVIDACKAHGTRLVFVDNVYLYAPEALSHMTERSAIGPVSKKGKIRKQVVDMLLTAVTQGELKALIARSADFYGPGIRNSILLELVYNNLKKGKPALWQCDAGKVHSFTYTPDAAEAVAVLGNRDEAYNRVWHLPTAKDRLTGADWVTLFSAQLQAKPTFFVLRRWLLKLAGLVVPLMRELEDMSYQYQYDYFFDSSDIEQTFGLKATPITQAISEIVAFGRR
ncbi:NAD-dependent epimerase/dehydratase family protein [Parapedobacter koreensis]|uniref:Nucleoside-diphosphate-sugar epimerase n=1 Tax=Parapedobacter koreensis TaxID=332977 RepID=A0A1H7QQZ1_9SPHI|nr:NAD-dependent epimerase/dehydratase family protein [Parapedobacter koreensis]SEL50128.1 Nucleoside-diphosphate-sugar epimerase [Parapedobacter koreensis]